MASRACQIPRGKEGIEKVPRPGQIIQKRFYKLVVGEIVLLSGLEPVVGLGDSRGVILTGLVGEITGHHPDAGSAIRQRGTLFRQAGRGVQEGAIVTLWFVIPNSIICFCNV